MNPSLTDKLCTRCGICCDGSLLADVRLTGGCEADRADDLGLRVDHDSYEHVMLLPCAALSGTCCGVYAHRPRTCRSFECHLLLGARNGRVSIPEALERIAEAREGIEHVRSLLTAFPTDDPSLPLRERCADALSAEPRPHTRAGRRSAELAAASASLLKDLDRVFLGRD